jgi:hypothetical protein
MNPQFTRLVYYYSYLKQMWWCYVHMFTFFFFSLTARQFPYVHPTSDFISRVWKLASASELRSIQGFGGSTRLYSTNPINRSNSVHKHLLHNLYTHITSDYPPIKYPPWIRLYVFVSFLLYACFSSFHPSVPPCSINSVASFVEFFLWISALTLWRVVILFYSYLKQSYESDCACLYSSPFVLSSFIWDPALNPLSWSPQGLPLSRLFSSTTD